MTNGDLEAADCREPKRPRFQFGLAAILAVQTIASVALGIWKGHGTAALVAIVVFGGMFTSSVAGAVWIACDMQRAARLAEKYGRWVLYAVVAGLVLFFLVVGLL